MTPDEIKTIIETVITNKIRYYWVYILLSVILALVSVFLFEYLKNKAKNTATKEDIEILTKKVEEIKSEYIKQVEDFKGNQLLKNQKKKDLYDKVEELSALIIRAKNESAFNNWKQLSKKMQDVMISISTNAIFNELFHERDLIEADHNIMVRNISEGHPIANFDNTVKALESIQNKMMQ
jgi:mannitol-specific phosphotransferase system IIBC component